MTTVLSQPTAPRGYAAVKELARELKRNIPELLALDRSNDPFFVGSPAQRKQAEWFMDVWQRHDLQQGIHLRRVHYRLISQREPWIMPDGSPYENTEKSWGTLTDAAKHARHLGLLDPEAIEDHRNPDPQLFEMAARETPAPYIHVEPVPYWDLPRISTELGAWLNFPLPGAETLGYGYSQADQPYHLEIWIEKSTMDDVLVPLCRQYGINLVRGIGFQSVTGAVNLLLRSAQAGKPIRVFYISDYDPAGAVMPVAVARHLEYYLLEKAPSIQLKLTPLALTREQVAAYQLPRTPVKDTDTRKAGWQERHGEGATELDALEALFPGSLAAIVLSAIAPYRDMTLMDRLGEASIHGDQQVRQMWRELTAPEREILAEIEEETRNVVDRFRDRLVAMNEDLQAALAPLAERLEVVRHATEEKAEELREQYNADIPSRPSPVIAEAEESEWLYDSDRDYMEQLAVYQAKRGRA